MTQSANERQVGGDHYGVKEYQHWDWIAVNFGPKYFVMMATKYVVRWREKDGVKDLDKASHYVEKLRELYDKGVFEKYPHSKDPLEMDKLRDTYGLTGKEDVFCTTAVTYQNRGDLDLMLFLIEQIKLEKE